MTALREIPAPAHGAGSEPQLLTASKLRDRGWTNALIRKFASMPDDYAANFAYPGGAPVRLYRKDRVNTIEESEDFRQAKEQSTKRRAAGIKAKDTKREAALKWITGLDGPKLPPAPREELARLAVDWFNQTHAWRGDCGRWILLAGQQKDCADVCTTTNESDAAVVDYILFQLHPYETKLRRAIGKLPAPEDLAIIRGKLLAAIARAFSWLAKECERRKNGSGTA